MISAYQTPAHALIGARGHQPESQRQKTQRRIPALVAGHKQAKQTAEDGAPPQDVLADGLAGGLDDSPLVPMELYVRAVKVSAVHEGAQKSDSAPLGKPPPDHVPEEDVPAEPASLAQTELNMLGDNRADRGPKLTYGQSRLRLGKLEIAIGSHDISAAIERGEQRVEGLVHAADGVGSQDDRDGGAGAHGAEPVTSGLSSGVGRGRLDVAGGCETLGALVSAEQQRIWG